MDNNVLSSISLFVLIALLVGGFSGYMVQDAFAATVSITSWIANDPNDGDTIYSDGDTLTLTFSGSTNATNGGTMTDAEVKGNFTFQPQNLETGATFSGSWTALNTLVITVVTAGTDAIISTTTIGGETNPTAGDGLIGALADGTDNGLDNTNGLRTTASTALTGDFGLFVAVTATSNNGGGCDDCTAPTLGINENGKRLVDNGFIYNGNPIDVERYFTPYPLVTVDVGKQNVAEFKIYDDKGPDFVSHFELAFGLAKDESIGNSKAVINWDKTFDGIETITLNDPENVLDKIKVTTSEGSCSEESETKCLIVKVIHTFRAPLDFDILGTNVWDTTHNAWQNYYNHGIEVTGESLNPAKEYDGINAGHIYPLTETGKTTAVDEFGGTWSFQYGKWMKDYTQNKRVADTTSVFTRNHSDFAEYKELQAQNAIPQLLEYCPSCLTAYDDFKDSFGYSYPDDTNRINDLRYQIEVEKRKAIKILDDAQKYNIAYPKAEIDRSISVILAEEKQ